MASRTSKPPRSAKAITTPAPAAPSPPAGRLGGSSLSGNLTQARSASEGFEMLRRHPSLALRACILAILTLSCSGCATYPERTLKLHNAYYDNQLAEAQAAASDQIKHDRANRDLLKLDAAMID